MRHADLRAVGTNHQDRLCTLHITKARDIAVTADGAFEITNAVDHMPRSDVVLDVKICATVHGAGDWKAKWTANNTKLLNPTLTQAEAAKYTKHKHERNYAGIET